MPDSGHVLLDGEPLKPEHIQNIGYLPEETYLYKYLSAKETIDFFGSLFQLSGPEKKKRTEQLLEMVGMKNAGKWAVGEYSKGMARRIGLAQAYVCIALAIVN